MKVKKVFKYGTGQTIPEGAVYLCTRKQLQYENPETGNWVPCWLVWHYFLVEVEDDE